jgi:Raf kinase inhibitor-like YbhB/YbcL family protein
MKYLFANEVTIMKIIPKFIPTISLLILAGILPFGCAAKKPSTTSGNLSKTKIPDVAVFSLKSPAFNNNKALPPRFACGSEGISPPLTLANLPQKTKTVTIILEDPDAPKGTFTHWIMWNWPASKTEIPAALPTQAKLESGAIQGTGSNGKVGYNPPCPPSGTHRYYLKAYALDSTLKLPSTSDKQALLAAMQGHVIGQGMLMGTYHK